MNSKALMLGAVSVALAAGTFFVLNKIAPQRHVEKSQVQTGPTVDEVFAGQLQVAEIDEGAPPPTAAPAAEGEAAPTEAPPAEVATEVAAAETESAMPTEEPAAAAPPSEPASAPAPAPTAEPAPPPAAPEPEPAPAAAAAPAEAPAEPAPAPKPVAKPKPKAKPKAEAAAPVTAWWGSETPSQLSLVYAGSAAYRKAIVLMFNGAFNDASAANGSVKVTDANGKKVSGSWELSDKNPRMLVFPVDKAGKYKVVVASGLKDRNNRDLGTTIQGPVVVR